MSRSLQLRRPWVCTKCAHQSSNKLSTRTISSQPSDKNPPPFHPPLSTLTSPPNLPGKSIEHANIPPSSLAQYWDTIPPSKTQLKHASNYFHHHPPKFLWSAPKFHSMDFGHSPEVAFLGRSNVGKSSLLNALIGTTLAHTSSKRGRTRAMNAFSIGADDSSGDDGRKLVVIDMPGYGKGGHAEWGTEILKYLEKRKELRRTFVLIDSEHGLKRTDIQLLSSFREMDIPYQVILAKVDKLLFPSVRIPSEEALNKKLKELEDVMVKMRERLGSYGGDGGSALGEVIACSSEKRINGKRGVGIDAVQFAVLRAVGMELTETFKAAAQEEIVPYDELVWKD